MRGARTHADERLEPDPLFEIRGRADARRARSAGAHSARFGAPRLRSGLRSRQQRGIAAPSLPGRKSHRPRHFRRHACACARARAASPVRQAGHRELGARGSAGSHLRQCGAAIPARTRAAFSAPDVLSRAGRSAGGADAEHRQRILACADAHGRGRRALVVAPGADRQDPAAHRGL